MTTFTCKCGKTFEKNTNSSTTGNRMHDYGPQHECWGCPYVCKVMTWDPMLQKSAVQNHECRGSKTIRYDTAAALSLGDKCVGRIYSLDLDFLHRIREYANTLDGIEPDQYAFSDRAADYCDDGRFKLTVYPTQNNKGIQAKQQLFKKFFNMDGTRQDILPEEEKSLVLDSIKKLKEAAQHMSSNETARHNYLYKNDTTSAIYKVAQMDDGRYGVQAEVCGGNSTPFFISSITPKDTFEEAQNALDGYAMKYKMTAAEPEQPEDEPVPEQMELTDVAQEDTVAQEESVTSEDKSDSGTDESSSKNTEAENDTLENENDSAGNNVPSDESEQQAEEDGADAQPEAESEQKPTSDIVAGERVSLRDSAFKGLLDACDLKINRALQVAVKAKQGFTFQAKVTFDYVGNAFSVKHETGYQFDPIKVKDKGMLDAEIPIQLDADGNPVIPYDREKQLTFDDVGSNDNTVKTTVDGKTSLVEDVDTDNDAGTDEPADAEVADAVSEEPGENPDPGPYVDDEPPYPCENIDCPFWELNDETMTGECEYSDNASMDADYLTNVAAAVVEHHCEREEVASKYNDIDGEDEAE